MGPRYLENLKIRLFHNIHYYITTFLIIILVIVSSNISYSQSSDSLHLVKTNLFQSHDSVINNSNPQMIEDFIDNSSKSDSYDTHLFRIINYHRSKFKDDVLPGFTKSVVPMVLFMPLSTFLYGRINHKTFDENTGYLLAVNEAANFILTYGAKFLFKETRPYKVLRGVTEYTNLPLDPYAFPSAHTSFAFTIATTFALRYPKYPQLYVPIYMWAVLVAYSRPYLGVHYPVDVLGGFLIATGSTFLMNSLRSQLLKFKNHLFRENKQDEGSINGGVVTIFAASFLISELLTSFVLPDSPLLVDIIPSSKNRSVVNITLNYNF